MIEWHEELFCASEQTLHSLRIVVEEPSDIRNYLADNGQPLYKVMLSVELQLRDSCKLFTKHKIVNEPFPIPVELRGISQLALARSAQH